jgi:hypothetical protein
VFVLMVRSVSLTPALPAPAMPHRLRCVLRAVRSLLPATSDAVPQPPGQQRQSNRDAELPIGLRRYRLRCRGRLWLRRRVSARNASQSLSIRAGRRGADLFSFAWDLLAGLLSVG